MGKSGTRIAWWDEFINLLSKHYYIILFDNRDVGKSTRIVAKPPNLGFTLLKQRLGFAIKDVPYTLSDMAQDVIGLLDHLNISKSHLLGVSMGGMICQQLVIDHPTRVKSVISCYSSPSDGGLPSWTLMKSMISVGIPNMKDKDEWVKYYLKLFQIFSPVGMDKEHYAKCASEMFDDPNGFPNADGEARQNAAVWSSCDRTPYLKNVSSTIPFTVIHGALDPICPLQEGIKTAQAVPHSKMHILPECGHDITSRYFQDVLSYIQLCTSSSSLTEK